MEGYDVVTNDDKKFGNVVRVEGDTLVVEHGMLLKRKVALPRDLTEVDDGARVVRTTVSKELLDDAPKLDSDRVDENAVAAFFGLARGVEAPNTEGYGEMLPDDPAFTAEDDARRLGVETAEEERLRVRQGVGQGEADTDKPPPSPGLTGGDRFRDAPGLDSKTQ